MDCWLELAEVKNDTRGGVVCLKADATAMFSRLRVYVYINIWVMWKFTSLEKVEESNNARLYK